MNAMNRTLIESDKTEDIKKNNARLTRALELIIKCKTIDDARDMAERATGFTHVTIDTMDRYTAEYIISILSQCKRVEFKYKSSIEHPVGATVEIMTDKSTIILHSSEGAFVPVLFGEVAYGDWIITCFVPVPKTNDNNKGETV